jgi:hypothetical protein
VALRAEVLRHGMFVVAQIAIESRPVVWRIMRVGV